MHAIVRAAHDAPPDAPLPAVFRGLLAAAGGVLLLALPWAYPLPGGAAGPVLVGLAMVGIGRRRGRFGSRGPWHWLAFVPIGYGWGYAHVAEVLEAGVPGCADRIMRPFELEILETPRLTDAVARFAADVTVPVDRDCPGLGRHRVRLAWYEPPELKGGQRWRVDGRLRPPWGYRNPGGFDYERWLLGQGLGGTGYVRQGQALGLPEPASLLDGLRDRVRRWVSDADVERGAIILALMIGDDAGISAEEWQALRDSGTVHLMVVSGLHVGMIAGLVFQLGRLLSRMAPPLLLAVGSRRPAAVLAVTVSAAYVVLSGSGVPAVRAWLMSAIVLAALSSARRIGAKPVLGLVCALVLLANPLVVHQNGFWLSFAAVAALVWFFEPRQQRSPSPFLALLKVQAVLFVALSPLLSADQHSVPMVAPLVNLVAVPLVTLLVLPLVLVTGAVSLVAAEPAELLLRFADWLLGLLMTGVGSGAGVPGIAMAVSGPAQWLVLTAAIALLGGAPGWRAAVLLLLVWVAVLLPDERPPPWGEVRVSALDVGQGSAIVLDTRHHRLLYDTGPRFPSGFDLGEAAVVPSIRAGRNGRLDALILSHDDLDHTGGAQSVIRALKPTLIWTSFDVRAATPVQSRRCRQGESWHWDGVQFSFLHPPRDWRGSDNDASCVLLIEAGDARVLIAGDVSARVEGRLPKRPVDLVFAPHHGSATSSSRGFVRGFDPKVVFIDTDRRSRYGHPHPTVLSRYQHARVHVTGRTGALRWESGNPESVEGWRRDHGAYWHGAWHGS